MSIIEIRCPRCGSVSHLKNKETHEYSCDHCNATFFFLDTTKKEIITDVRRHNCPICGRAVKVEEGNICKRCKKVDLCKKCVDEVNLHNNKIWCKECIKEINSDCDVCGKYWRGGTECGVCGQRKCQSHCHSFDISIPKYSKLTETKSNYYVHLRCPKCGGSVCNNCFTEKKRFLGSLQYYCKKCGSKLRLNMPLVKEHREFNKNNF